MMEYHKSTISDIRLIDLPKIHNRAGNITPINNSLDVPFDIERVYYLYDIPSGESRGGHAHKELHQLIVAASGSFTLVFSDGRDRKEILLNRPDRGVLIVPGIWRELIDFSSGAICLVLASHQYDADDYIHDFEEFRSSKSSTN